MIHLDTSFLIGGLVPGSPEGERLEAWIADGETLAITTLAWTEFLCGPVGETEVGLAARFLGEPVPFGAEDAAKAASLFNLSGRRRGTLVDCMIAAVAIRAGARLATANVRDFRRLAVGGLVLAAQ